MLSAGFVEVASYLQSGNIVFAAGDISPSDAARGIEDLILEQLGLAVRVLVRTHAELAEVVSRNPLTEATNDPRRLLVLFLSDEPDRNRLDGIDPVDFEPDVFALDGRQLYIWHPDGVGNSRLTAAFWDRRLGVSGTARNWNTVLKLLELTGA